jgi:predicted secreted protein
MSRLRLLLAALLAVAALAALAVPASASVGTARSSSFCKPITGISDKLQSEGTDTSKFNANTFKRFARALRSSAAHAPAKVKKAGRTLASFYGALGGGDPTALRNTANVSGAIGTYFGYVAAHCN